MLNSSCTALRLLRTILIVQLFLFTIACNHEQASSTSESDSDPSVLAFPRALLDAKSLDSNLITAFLTVDNASRQAMTISNGTASAEVSGLSAGTHEFSIEFFYASPEHGSLAIASADKIFDTSVTQSISFIEGDYALPDDDGDGFVNITELNNAGWDPSDINNPGIDDDNYELNDTQATAYNLSEQEGVTLGDHRGFAKHADDDWYKVTLSDDRPRIIIDFSAESSENVQTELVDVGGMTLSESASQRSIRYHDFTVPQGGDYFIRVSSFQTTNSRYDLRWQALPAADEDNYESNNNNTEAFSLLNNQSDAFGSEGLSTLDGMGIQLEDDWYRIRANLNTLQRVEIDLNFIDNNGNIDIDVFNSGGEIQFQSRTDAQDRLPFDSDERVWFYTRQAQDYFIRVYGSDIGNRYELSWNNRTRSDTEDFYEFSETNNTLATATDTLFIYVNDDTNIISLANIWGTAIQNDDDWYEIEVEDNKKNVNLTLTSFESNNTLNMILTDSTGTAIAAASDSGSDKVINATVSTAGDYYVQVTGDNTGDIYNLEIALSAE